MSESVLDPNTWNIVFDNDAPVLTLFTATSNNDNNNKKAKVGDVITVTIKGDERLAKTADPSVEVPSVTIAGTVVTASATDDTDSTWTATYTMLNSDTEGSIPIVVNYKDYAGNSGPTKTQANLIPVSDAVIFDKTPPTLSFVSIASNNSNSVSSKSW